MVGTIICEVGTIMCDIGTINVRFYLLKIRYPYGYCRITQIVALTWQLTVKTLVVGFKSPHPQLSN